MEREACRKHAEQVALIQDVDKKCRYHVKVDICTIHSFGHARREMGQTEKLKMYMPCTVKTDEKGH